MNAHEILVAASKFRVCAFRKSDGGQIWETVLNPNFFKPGGPFVTLALDDTGVYAHAGRELFCLDLVTGRIVWRVEVRKLGTGVVSLALAGNSTSSTTSAFAHIAAERRNSDGGGDSCGGGGGD